MFYLRSELYANLINLWNSLKCHKRERKCYKEFFFNIVNIWGLTTLKLKYFYSAPEMKSLPPTRKNQSEKKEKIPQKPKSQFSKIFLRGKMKLIFVFPPNSYESYEWVEVWKSLVWFITFTHSDMLEIDTWRMLHTSSFDFDVSGLEKKGRGKFSSKTFKWTRILRWIFHLL